MEPYYQDDAVALYLGDCYEGMAELDLLAFDACITDPPYGIGFEIGARRQVVGNTPNCTGRMGGYGPVHGDDKPFDPAPFIDFPMVVLFGANHYADRLPASAGWLVWDKSEGGKGPSNSFADFELAWTNQHHPLLFRHLWKGLCRASESSPKNPHVHPTQKPVALMRWVLEQFTTEGDLIFDPFCGSGPIPRAAQELGRRCVAFEINERYAEAAARRCAQPTQDPLFGEA